MAKEFRLPDLGSGLQEGQIVNWLVEVGQRVTTSDDLCEVETEKAVIEIPVPYAGTVLELKAAAGDSVEVGSVIAVFGDEGESTGSTEAPVEAEATPDKPVVAQAAPAPAVNTTTATGRVKAMPSVRRIARQHDIELSGVAGSGRHGQITRNDILAILDNKPAATPAPAAPAAPAAATRPGSSSQFEPFSMIRKTISARLSQAWREIPHVFTRIEIDATRLLVVRKALIEELDMKIPIEAILIKACLPALKEFPAFNATIVEGGIELHQHYNIGVAADTETGLVVPVLKDADRMSLRELVASMLDLLPRAVQRKATPEELSGGTFTVNNIGALGNISGTSIIPHGTTAILSIGRAVQRPVAIDGEVEIRPILEVTLSFDHRAIDGGLAQRFMNRIQENLEEPVKALL
ncbi:MAG: 2-oxo acid dehydrogenase subunit E2 [Gammaproteobacteria bacterium]|nr:2-oxo acid dehydrogenase subunit E2 [Gammaproteobacteria bacterium]NNL49254.1 2-oxo acid dehydrogenase subunit E2 [Woeseiaceae bacterium]